MGWPFVGMPLMVLLGLSVRDGATPVDAWMQQASSGPLGSLLFFTDSRTVQTLLATTVSVALFRKLWLLVPLALATPAVGILSAETLKPVFGRLKDEALAYPSGHTTAMVIVLGMLILAVGARRWLVWAAVAFAALGILGQAVTYHYFTDALGAVLLGTSLVCVAAVIFRSLRRGFRGAQMRLRL
ncbi:MAG: phosphatase PAP2 family protein [Mycobacteriaceae bacterium]